MSLFIIAINVENCQSVIILPHMIEHRRKGGERSRWKKLFTWWLGLLNILDRLLIKRHRALAITALARSLSLIIGVDIGVKVLIVDRFHLLLLLKARDLSVDVIARAFSRLFCAREHLHQIRQKTHSNSPHSFI